MIIRSIENERCFLGNKHDAPLYLVDALRTLFKSVEVLTRENPYSQDGLIKCRKPKQSRSFYSADAF